MEDEGSAGSDDTDDDDEEASRLADGCSVDEAAAVAGGAVRQAGGAEERGSPLVPEPAAPPQQPALATASRGDRPERRGGRGGGAGRNRLSDIFRWPLGGGWTTAALPPAATVVPGASPDLAGGHLLSTSAGVMFAMDDMAMGASASSAASSLQWAHPDAASLPARLDGRRRGGPPADTTAATVTPSTTTLFQAAAISHRGAAAPDTDILADGEWDENDAPADLLKAFVSATGVAPHLSIDQAVIFSTSRIPPQGSPPL